MRDSRFGRIAGQCSRSPASRRTVHTAVPYSTVLQHGQQHHARQQYSGRNSPMGNAELYNITEWGTNSQVAARQQQSKAG